MSCSCLGYRTRRVPRDSFSLPHFTVDDRSADPHAVIGPSRCALVDLNRDESKGQVDHLPFAQRDRPGRPSRDECVRGGAVVRRRHGPATRMSLQCDVAKQRSGRLTGIARMAASGRARFGEDGRGAAKNLRRLFKMGPSFVQRLRGIRDTVATRQWVWSMSRPVTISAAYGTPAELGHAALGRTSGVRFLDRAMPVSDNSTPEYPLG